MNIYLGDHFDAFVREQVATGRYANASEVVREALRMYEDNQVKLIRLRAKIQEGLDDIEAGRVIRVEDLDAYFQGVRERAHEQVKSLTEESNRIHAAS